MPETYRWGIDSSGGVVLKNGKYYVAQENGEIGRQVSEKDAEDAWNHNKPSMLPVRAREFEETQAQRKARDDNTRNQVYKKRGAGYWFYMGGIKHKFKDQEDAKKIHEDLKVLYGEGAAMELARFEKYDAKPTPPPKAKPIEFNKESVKKAADIFHSLPEVKISESKEEEGGEDLEDVQYGLTERAFIGHPHHVKGGFYFKDGKYYVAFESGEEGPIAEDQEEAREGYVNSGSGVGSDFTEFKEHPEDRENRLRATRNGIYKETGYPGGFFFYWSGIEYKFEDQKAAESIFNAEKNESNAKRAKELADDEGLQTIVASRNHTTKQTERGPEVEQEAVEEVVDQEEAGEVEDQEEAEDPPEIFSVPQRPQGKGKVSRYSTAPLLKAMAKTKEPKIPKSKAVGGRSAMMKSMKKTPPTRVGGSIHHPPLPAVPVMEKPSLSAGPAVSEKEMEEKHGIPESSEDVLETVPSQLRGHGKVPRSKAHTHRPREEKKEAENAEEQVTNEQIYRSAGDINSVPEPEVIRRTRGRTFIDYWATLRTSVPCNTYGELFPFPDELDTIFELKQRRPPKWKNAKGEAGNREEFIFEELQATLTRMEDGAFDDPDLAHTFSQSFDMYVSDKYEESLFCYLWNMHGFRELFSLRHKQDRSELEQTFYLICECTISAWERGLMQFLEDMNKSWQSPGCAFSCNLNDLWFIQLITKTYDEDETLPILPTTSQWERMLEWFNERRACPGVYLTRMAVQLPLPKANRKGIMMIILRYVESFLAQSLKVFLKADNSTFKRKILLVKALIACYWRHRMLVCVETGVFIRSAAMWKGEGAVREDFMENVAKPFIQEYIVSQRGGAWGPLMKKQRLVKKFHLTKGESRYRWGIPAPMHVEEWQADINSMYLDDDWKKTADKIQDEEDREKSFFVTNKCAPVMCATLKKFYEEGEQEDREEMHGEEEALAEQAFEERKDEPRPKKKAHR